MSSILFARTRNATEDGNASALLQRIAHWIPKATREFGGHLWLTNAGRQVVGLPTAPGQTGGQP